jgi:hypothetical protein
MVVQVSLLSYGAWVGSFHILPCVYVYARVCGCVCVCLYVCLCLCEGGKEREGEEGVKWS